MTYSTPIYAGELKLYCAACIRPFLVYANAAWSTNVTLEEVKIRATRITFVDLSYAEALSRLNSIIQTYYEPDEQLFSQLLCPLCFSCSHLLSSLSCLRELRPLFA